jgi:hypothetical protein
MGTLEFTWKVPIIGEGYICCRTPQENETTWHENTRVGWVEYFSLRRGAKYESLFPSSRFDSYITFTFCCKPVIVTDLYYLVISFQLKVNEPIL